MCMYVVFCKIDHCIHIHWCIVMGLGHNDAWVESHMWPQQTWGRMSSRGQWPLVQVFGKKGQCIHILWCIFRSNILNECKRMWSRKQARHVVWEPPCLFLWRIKNLTSEHLSWYCLNRPAISNFQRLNSCQYCPNNGYLMGGSYILPCYSLSIHYGCRVVIID